MGESVTLLFPSYDAPPIMNAAGTVKTVSDVELLCRTPVPAVVVGSYTMHDRAGNEGRTYFGGPSATLNSMGLPGPSLAVWTSWVREMVPILHRNQKELWVSVAGFSPMEYRVLTEAAFEAGADAVEANLGCPNIWAGGEQKPIPSYSAELCAEVVAELTPIIAEQRVGVKLSPILDSVLLEAIDGILRRSRVAFVTAINTVPNCFAFDSDGRQAVTFGKGLAGMSGPAVKWLGLGQVMAHREQLPETPIIGVGGISSGRDLAEYLSQPIGAQACQVGTAFWERGPRCIVEILQEYALLSDDALGNGEGKGSES